MPDLVLSSLTLELGIDTSQFNQGEQDALNRLRNFQSEAVKSGTTIESQQKRIGNIMLDFRREALTTLGVFLGGKGIAEFTNYITNSEVALGNLSKTLGMSATDINAWDIAFQKIGGSPGSAQSALAGTNQALQMMRITGDQSAFRLAGFLGVNMTQVKDAADFWLKLSSAMQNLEQTNPALAASYMSQFPGANSDMINFALLGPGAMRQSLATATAENPITDADLKAAQDYKNAITDLTKSFENAGKVLVTLFGPWLTDKINRLVQLINPPPSTYGTLPTDFTTESGIAGLFPWTESNMKKTFSNWTGGALYGAGAFGSSLGMRAAAGGGSDDYETKIRAYAASLGLDPNQIMGISQKEGFGRSGTWWDVNGPSGGDFSLHDAPGGGAVGDLYEKASGHKIGDPRYRWEEDKFAIDYMSKHGAGAWSTWRGGPLARGPGAATAAGSRGVAMPAGAGAAGKSVSVTIGQINLDGSQVKDSAGFAQTVGPQLRRTVDASLFNGGGN